jgi:hypothetical protein
MTLERPVSDDVNSLKIFSVIGIGDFGGHVYRYRFVSEIRDYLTLHYPLHQKQFFTTTSNQFSTGLMIIQTSRKTERVSPQFFSNEPNQG